MTLKELHDIEVTHSVIAFCPCNPEGSGVCNKCGLEIYEPKKHSKMNTAKKIILDELIENSHIEKTEDVIFWALDSYCKDKENAKNGKLVAYAITNRITDAEKSGEVTLQNAETIEAMTPKTFDGWEESNLDLDQYLNSPCEIDERLALYIGEVVPPTFLSEDFTQGGDAIKSDENDVLYYMTVSHIGKRYFYLGVLPEFNQ